MVEERVGCHGIVTLSRAFGRGQARFMLSLTRAAVSTLTYMKIQIVEICVIQPV